MFFGRQRYPSITCPICNSNEPNTWLHVLLTCNQQHIHILQVKRHNKAVGEIKKLLISSEKSWCFTLMNDGTFNNNPQENTVPNWLLPCTCGTQRCHCNARFRHDIMCVKGLPYLNDPPPPVDIDPNLTIPLLNSHIVMTDSPQKQLKQKIINTDHQLLVSPPEDGKLNHLLSSLLVPELLLTSHLWNYSKLNSKCLCLPSKIHSK